MGNYKDNRIEQLADRGNGNHAYIDDIAEARKVLVQEMGATLVTVAKDVKLQVEFNPVTVQAYRLIGYENRALHARDFNDDAKDAGDLGAGHSVTALYEIVPAGKPLDVDIGSTPGLRYQQTATPGAAGGAARSDVATVAVRYKKPEVEVSRLMEHRVGTAVTAAGDDLRFAMAVAGYGMLLRGSPHRGSISYADIVSLARSSVGGDPGRYRADFLDMLHATRSLVDALELRRLDPPR
jgi:Ca-activated chloride channel family protein